MMPEARMKGGKAATGADKSEARAIDGNAW